MLCSFHFGLRLFFLSSFLHYLSCKIGIFLFFLIIFRFCADVVSVFLDYPLWIWFA